MKNLLWVLMAIVVCALGCAKNDCGGGSIKTVEPDGNPAGYQIKIKGSGFDADTKVRFDDLYGIVQFQSVSELFVTVPNGLVGNVTIVAESADKTCIGRSDQLFTVFGNYPADIPPSPTFIVVPVAPTVYPSDFQNLWQNLSDAGHSILLQGVDGIIDPEQSHENSNKSELLQDNPISGHFFWDEVAKTTDIEVIIDRSLKSGGIKETYKGELILPGSVGSDATLVLLLTSTNDGRQLLFGYF
ncbi:MAG TPA: IPT/TIG domain-containing protein [Flavilitoribacter sp.]|nr:IPT/TIG domain-containing protein [Flavilitoribacter sp.]HMQ88658.1 IPT/TIG domain-containing protein [Flavilitoribacter sp.]